MKILYFDCFSGISGDMTNGSLLDIGVDFNYLKKELEKLRLEGYEIEAKKIIKKGISATKFDVIILEEKIKEEHRHRKFTDIASLIEKSKLDKKIKEKSISIFRRIAEAESKVHGKKIEDIHFHEIGAIDSIIDIVGAVICLEKLSFGKIFSREIPMSKGFVKTEHGMLPIPAPATAEILKGIPLSSTEIEGEIVTPTGAAIIAEYAAGFGKMPAMKIEKIGYGSGTFEYEHPNVLRVFLGEANSSYDTDTVSVIETNIDDMNPEFYENAIEKLLKEGALDVFLTNIQMKKNRPGIMMSIIANTQDVQKLAEIVFKETTTFGLRIYETERMKLSVEKKKIKTKYGEITIKIGKIGGKIVSSKPEYKECKKISDEKGIRLKEIYKEIAKCNLKHQDELLS